MEANRLDPNSLTPKTELLELLKEKCPEVFTEGKVDVDKLRQSLGDEVDSREGKIWIVVGGQVGLFQAYSGADNGNISAGKRRIC